MDIPPESKLKDNGSSTTDFEDDVISDLLSKVHRDFEDDVINELLSKVHRHV